MNTNTNSKATEIRAWCARRWVKGIQPNADDIWAHINIRWPNLSEELREEIFQKVKP